MDQSKIQYIQTLIERRKSRKGNLAQRFRQRARKRDSCNPRRCLVASRLLHTTSCLSPFHNYHPLFRFHPGEARRSIHQVQMYGRIYIYIYILVPNPIFCTGLLINLSICAGDNAASYIITHPRIPKGLIKPRFGRGAAIDSEGSFRYVGWTSTLPRASMHTVWRCPRESTCMHENDVRSVLHGSS